MQAIVKHSFFISNASVPEQQNYRMGASPNPQDIPDWVTKTPTYLAGVKGGTIFEVNPAAAKKGAKVAELEASNKRLADAASYAEMEKRVAQQAKEDAERLVAEREEKIKQLEAQLAAVATPVDADKTDSATDEASAGEQAGEPCDEISYDAAPAKNKGKRSK
jgi:hypothetical protein